MPFYREWNGGGEKVVNRDRTGPAPPPEPGIAQTEDGVIVGSLDDPNGVRPGTFVQVNLPGPREVLFDKHGNISPRWYRFFLELYRRTGGPNDNVNVTGSLRKVPLAPDSLTLSGIAPSAQITHSKTPTAASISITGAAPEAV